jgi:5-methylcytosine-specific restriction enzyme subunit McrC
MERIFEDYVAVQLGRQYPDWQVTTQARDHYLASQEGKNFFLMQPDLVFQRGRIRVVADTKWKLLGGEAGKPAERSISQADLYQMYAYGSKYLHDQNIKEVYLIYPKSAGFTRPLPVFDYDGSFRLYVVPYDLSPGVDRLLVSDGGLLAEN